MFEMSPCLFCIVQYQQVYQTKNELQDKDRHLTMTKSLNSIYNSFKINDLNSDSYMSTVYAKHSLNCCKLWNMLAWTKIKVLMNMKKEDKRNQTLVKTVLGF